MGVKKTGNQCLGVDVDVGDDGTLCIKRINPGLIKSWNATKLGITVKPGDYLTGVNGIQSDVPEMMIALKQDLELHLTFSKAKPCVTESQDQQCDVCMNHDQFLVCRKHVFSSSGSGHDEIGDVRTLETWGCGT